MKILLCSCVCSTLCTGGRNGDSSGSPSSTPPPPLPPSPPPPPRKSSNVAAVHQTDMACWSLATEETGVCSAVTAEGGEEVPSTAMVDVSTVLCPSTVTEEDSTNCRESNDSPNLSTSAVSSLELSVNVRPSASVEGGRSMGEDCSCTEPCVSFRVVLCSDSGGVVNSLALHKRGVTLTYTGFG